MNTNTQLSHLKNSMKSSGHVTIIMLILIGLFTSLFYSILQLSALRRQNQRTVQQTITINQITKEIDTLLSEPDACRMNLEPLLSNTHETPMNSISSSSDASIARVFTAGSHYSPDNRLGTTGDSENFVVLDAITFVPQTHDPTKAMITLDFSKKPPTNGSTIAKRTIRIGIEDTGGTPNCISNSSFDPSAVNSFCQSFLSGYGKGNHLNALVPSETAGENCELFYLTGTTKFGKIRAPGASIINLESENLTFVKKGPDPDNPNVMVEDPLAVSHIRLDNIVVKGGNINYPKYIGGPGSLKTKTLQINDTFGALNEVCFGEGECSTNTNCISTTPTTPSWEKIECGNHPTGHTRAGKPQKLTTVTRGGSHTCADVD